MAASSMEWNELAASDLPSLGPRSDAAWPQRDFSQLQAEGQSLLRRSGASLASTSVRASGLVRDDPTVNQTNGTSFPSTNLGRPAESLEDLIHQHDQEIMANHIQNFLEETRQNTADAVERQLQAAWEEDRAAWFHNLVGHRYVGENSASNTSNALVPLRTATSSFPASASQSIQLYKSPASVSTTLDNASAQAHLKVVKEFMGQERRSEDLVCIEQFANVAASVGQSLENRPATLGYSSAWKLMANLLRVPNSPVQQATATLAHLCKQFQSLVSSRVREATSHANTYGSPLANSCETFARLLVGFTDPWVVAYYCLRCGDAVAASEVLQQTSADDASRRIVHSMALAQGKALCVWEGSHNWFIQMNPADRRVASDLLESAKLLDDGVASKLHQVGIYSLLSGSNSQPILSNALVGFKTIEDYLMQCLWKAVLQPNIVDELIGVAELVVNFGPSYFDDPSSGGWSYATPLLLSQQYQKALQWLAESGNLIHATHLGLVFAFAGVTVRNLGDSDSLVNDTIASLIVAYSKELLKEHGVLVAMDYLVHIPNDIRVQKEIASLIATTRDYNTLVGTLDADGARLGGALAERFTPDQISLIAQEAANLLALRKDDQEAMGAAVMCLLLGERYAAALSLMNELLSPANKPDSNRAFWIEQATSFYQYYLSRRTRVSEALGRENQTSLIRTYRRLLDLNALFSKIDNGQIDNACRQLAHGVHLLPESEDDRHVKLLEARDLDPLINAMYPFLLVGAMKILVHDHNRLKHEARMGGPESGRHEMQVLRKKARLYTSFAASIAVGSEQSEAITQLDAIMI